jgi:hypothetical protein
VAAFGLPKQRLKNLLLRADWVMLPLQVWNVRNIGTIITSAR